MQVNLKSENNSICSYSYYIAYDKDGGIVGRFSFYTSLLKFLSENADKEITYKTFPSWITP